jgi:CRISPR-associated protein Cmr4
MKTMLLGLLAETPIHSGSGQDAGFVDLPVAREAATSYPVIAGSSFKGALLDRFRGEISDQKQNDIFGRQDSAGNLIVSDIRLVALPVRSLSSSYKWVTCPHLIERLVREIRRSVGSPSRYRIAVKQGEYLGAGNEDIFLEERQFHHGGPLLEGLDSLIESLVLHEETRSRVDDQLVVVHDDDFVWFARYGLSVSARNVLDDVKMTSNNLWYEETIPTDSIFYSLLAERGKDALSEIVALFKDKPYIQVGGNATVGQGWFAVKSLLMNGEEK